VRKKVHATSGQASTSNALLFGQTLQAQVNRANASEDANMDTIGRGKNGVAHGNLRLGNKDSGKEREREHGTEKAASGNGGKHIDGREQFEINCQANELGDVGIASKTSRAYESLVNLTRELQQASRALDVDGATTPSADAKHLIKIAMRTARTSLVFADCARADASAARSALAIEWNTLCTQRLCFVARVNELKRRGELLGRFGNMAKGAESEQATHAAYMQEALADVARAEHLVLDLLPVQMRAAYGTSVDREMLEAVEHLS
jgi:hypothetical protein